jgi:hypothetical protein
LRASRRRLGAHEGRLDYFVCVSGHLHGSCWLARVSDSDEDGERDGADCSGSLSDDNEFGAVASSEEYYGRMAL